MDTTYNARKLSANKSNIPNKMPSLIQSMLERLFPPTDLGRLLFLGLDASGRTTALYRLKLDETITTIPTIGFNVETIEHRRGQPRRGETGGLWTIWDVGGCDKIRPLWRHYFHNTHALVYFVDSNDRDRLGETRDELLRLVNEPELAGCRVLVFANKRDLAGAMGLDELQAVLPQHLDRDQWHLQPCVATTGEGLWEGLDWLLADNGRNCGDSPGEDHGGDDHPDGGAGIGVPLSPEEEQDQRQRALMEEWLSRADNSDDEFLEQLWTYTLDSWDHRTHLRIAWILLTRHGRQKGLPLIFDGIKNFIENSDRTKRARGTTFHETMTYFWVHLVHYALVATML